MEKQIKKIAAYCAANITDYDERVKISLGKMDRMRCPLRMAEPTLYDEMCEKIGEWGYDNEVDVEDVDVEEVFFYNEDK